jgi:hypothetical protein
MEKQDRQTGEISNDEIDRDAMRRTDERVRRERADKGEKGEIESEASRSELGAGE